MHLEMSTINPVLYQWYEEQADLTSSSRNIVQVCDVFFF